MEATYNKSHTLLSTSVAYSLFSATIFWIFMAVVLVCYKLPFKDQSLLLHVKDSQNEKTVASAFTNNYSSSCSFKVNISAQREKRCLACDAYKSNSDGKQLQSLEAYFEKLQQDPREPFSVPSNNKEEFIKPADNSLFGQVIEDGNSTNFSSSAYDDIDTTEEALYVKVGSARGGWRKLENYVRLKEEADSKQLCSESSGIYIIGILVSINIAVFLFEIASPVQNSDLELFSIPSVYGAKINHLILLGEWWRLFTPMFLHWGIFHILLGCWVLISFGPQVCRAYGSFTFLLIYILGGISGNLTSFLQTPDPTVGGTGPVFAVIGAWLIYQFQNKDAMTKNESEIMFQKAIIATAISFILSNFGPIDDWTHFGAALTGISYGLLTCPVLLMDDKFTKSGRQEGIRLVRRYADPCKSVLVFSLFLLILSSLLFVVDPPLTYLQVNSFSQISDTVG